MKLPYSGRPILYNPRLGRVRRLRGLGDALTDFTAANTDPTAFTAADFAPEIVPGTNYYTGATTPAPSSDGLNVDWTKLLTAAGADLTSILNTGTAAKVAAANAQSTANSYTPYGYTRNPLTGQLVANGLSSGTLTNLFGQTTAGTGMSTTTMLMFAALAAGAFFIMKG